jgi:hypothetical protein
MDKNAIIISIYPCNLITAIAHTLQHIDLAIFPEISTIYKYKKLCIFSFFNF